MISRFLYPLVVLILFQALGTYAIAQTESVFKDQGGKALSSGVESEVFQPNLISGSINFTIPLVSVSSDAFPLSVSLNRSSEAIPVKKLAGEAGVGWSLSTGISLNVIVRDMPDSERGAWDMGLPAGPIVTSPSFYWPTNFGIINHLESAGWQDGVAQSGLWDAAWNLSSFCQYIFPPDFGLPYDDPLIRRSEGLPDIYVLTIGGVTTRFFFMPSRGMDAKAIALEPSNYSLYRYADGNIIAVSSDGIKFEFALKTAIYGKSTTEGASYDYKNYPSTPHPSVNVPYSETNFPTAISASTPQKILGWKFYPTSVYSDYHSDKIVFSYEESEQWEYDEYDELGFLLQKESCPGCNGMWFEYPPTYSSNFTLQKRLTRIQNLNKYLTKIENNLSVVNLLWDDMRGSGISASDPGKYLREVGVKNKIDNKVTSMQLKYVKVPVVGGGLGATRILLSEISSTNFSGYREVSYKFHYNLDLNGKGFDPASLDFDYLGNYNAAGNQGYLSKTALQLEVPTVSSGAWLFSNPLAFPEVSRDPNHNIATGYSPAIVFTIRSIETGSKLNYTFDYEPHSYFNGTSTVLSSGLRIRKVSVSNINSSFIESRETEYKYDSTDGHSWGTIYASPNFTYTSYNADEGTNGMPCSSCENINGYAARVSRTFYLSTNSWTPVVDGAGRSLIYTKVHRLEEGVRTTTYFSTFKRKQSSMLTGLNVQSNGSVISYFIEKINSFTL